MIWGGNSLAGALFELRDINDNTIFVHETNSKGELTIDHIVQGDYTLYELRAPEGHSISQELASGKAISVNQDTSDGIAVALNNTPSSVELRKVNENNDALSGAEFYLYEKSGTGWQRILNDKKMVSNSNGYINVTALDVGDYRFVESTAPEGYIKNTKPIDFSVTKDGSVYEDVTLQAINYKGEIELEKTNVSGQALSGAAFDLMKVESKGKTKIKSVSTNDDGIISAGGLVPRNPLQFKIATEASGKPGVMDIGEFKNYEFLGVININKVDQNDEPVDGAEFSLYHIVDGESILIEEGLKTEDGIVSIDNLHPGDFQVIETKAPKGHKLDSKPKDITITYDQIGNGEEHDITVVNKVTAVQDAINTVTGDPVKLAIMITLLILAAVLIVVLVRRKINYSRV